jgi:hypothetical protein
LVAEFTVHGTEESSLLFRGILNEVCFYPGHPNEQFEISSRCGNMVLVGFLLKGPIGATSGCRESVEIKNEVGTSNLSLALYWQTHGSNSPVVEPRSWAVSASAPFDRNSACGCTT